MKKGRGLFNFSEILNITGGTALAPVREQEEVLGVSVDSREIKRGDLFIPLPGENTDGHFYLLDALKGGAAGVLISKRWMEERGEETISLLKKAGNFSAAVVEEPLKALKGLAKNFLDNNATFIRFGITGSSGKTTTKELLAGILEEDKPTWKNPGNFNSEIGLPLACFTVTKDYSYGVFELGMNHPGEMDFLTEIVKPDFAAITNVGTAHLGLLGSRDAIAWEKKRIFSAFTGKETAVVFEDDPYKDFLSEGVRGRVVEYGRRTTPGFEKALSLGLEGTRVIFRQGEIHYPLFGEHNLQNLLCAVSIASEAGIDFKKIKAGAESVKGLFGRSQIFKGKVTLVQDFYNANYDSMIKTINFIEEIPWQNRKVLVLGSMKELGENTSRFHRELGEKLSLSRAAGIFLFGEEMEYAYKVLENKKEQVFYFPSDYTDLERKVLSFIEEGDLILIKGSRSLKLERLADTLLEGQEPGRMKSV